MKREERPYVFWLIVIVVATVLGFVFGPELASFVRSLVQ